MAEARGVREKKMPVFKWDLLAKLLFATPIVFGAKAYGSAPVGIVGGQGVDSFAGADFVTDSSGAVESVLGLPATSYLYSVSINASGLGLVGGNTSTEAYAAFVSSGIITTPLAIGIDNATIYSVSINQAGNGLIGGDDSITGYAALVQSDGAIQSLSPAARYLNGVSLNDSDLGLIGGEGNTSDSYAAFVDPDGTLTPVMDLPDEAANILSVDLNQNGVGIVGGYAYEVPYSAPFAAFVTQGGSPLFLSAFPSGNGQVDSVAINDSGLALVGGQVDSSNAYAGFASSDGTLTPLFETPFAGRIRWVDLNSEGTGIIGGSSGGDLYAALVDSNGTINPLFSSSTTGEIFSVAINEAGLGLIGGQTDGTDGYAALVAPNGTLTLLDMSDMAVIESVDLSSILDEATPKSVGPFSSIYYTQLAYASAMDTRFVQRNRVWKKKGAQRSGGRNSAYNDELNLASNNAKIALTPRPTPGKESPSLSEKQNSFWAAPFGDFVYLKAQGSIPRYSNEVAGVLVGYDHHNDNYIAGAALGYAFNYVHYSQSLGHAKVQEEVANLYGCYFTDHFRLNAVLWGGFYQLRNTRHTLDVATSKGNTHGWILSPHLELASPWEMDQNGFYFVEPFVQFDWINNWQRKYTEHGTAGFNLNVEGFYGCLLQSEAGLRFYERFAYGWGDFYMEEKVSYVNQAPFQSSSMTTSFVGSASSFPIGVASSKVENLAALQLIGAFVPQNSAYPYGGIAGQVTANSSYQSYFVSVYGGIDF